MNQKHVIKATALVLGLSSFILLTGCSEKDKDNSTELIKLQEIEKGENQKEVASDKNVQEDDYAEKELEAIMKAKLNLELKEGFTFEAEEPGRYILQYEENPNYFSRVELLGRNILVDEVKKNTQTALESVGNVQDYTESLGTEVLSPLYENAVLYMYASNEEYNQNVVVKKVDGMFIRITIFYENKEESEGITPHMIQILETLTIIQ